MKHRALGKIAASVSLGAAALLSGAPARACGGFFCSQAQPVNQAAERIIFADDGAGTITAQIQILYEGPSENFSWLLPIASVPEGDEIAVGSDLAFSRLQLATNPQFNLTTRVEGRCRSEATNDIDSIDLAPSFGDEESASDSGGGINLEASGVVGAFEYAVISVAPGLADPAAPATEWLTANGYDIPPGGAERVGPYLAEGMYLLALRLTKGASVGSIRPIQLTYAASAPMIPIKLTAVAANEDMGVMAWVLSSARSVPFNYNALELNEARINWFNASSNYGQVINEAADEAGGQGFVTEFAAPSATLADVVWSGEENTRWQTIVSSTDASRRRLFDDLSLLLSNASGFGDVLRTQVQLPAGVSFEDFQACASCYADAVAFERGALLAAMERDVVEPLRRTQALIDQAPYTTRLYSTLSAAEMSVDPVFVANPDLPDVSNLHQATRVIECNPLILERDASWRIDFPQGTTIRGTASGVGQWPSEVDAQPPNLRVLTLGASGEGVVVADNTGRIEDMLADYNSGVPFVEGSSAGGGGCSLSARGPAPASARALPASLGLLALLGSAALFRTRRARLPRARR
jgi:uncharacterized protein DUF2330